MWATHFRACEFEVLRLECRLISTIEVNLKTKTCFFLIVIVLLAGSEVFSWNGKVIGIYDGDTISVLNGNRKEKIRLYGIDCPEHEQPFYQKAKSFTSARVFGKQVEVRPVDTDKYGRIVAWVYVGAECLNLELVRNGLAWHYKFFAANEPELESLEKDARERRVGIWSQKNPEAPWHFRRK